MKTIELTERRYTSKQVTEILGIPAKTVQGALTSRTRFARAGVRPDRLPYQDEKGVWQIPSGALVTWANRWRGKPADVEFVLAKKTKAA